MTVKNNTTIIASIRNRNQILQQTLPNWLLFDISIIIVDWRDDGCESAWDIVKSFNNPLITLIETKFEYRFTISHALNLAISQVKTEYILKLDVDYLLHDDFFDKNILAENEFICGCKLVKYYNADNSLYGCLFTKKEYIDTIGGYNENLIFYGADDTNLYNRLATQYKQVMLSIDSVTHIPHSNKMSFVNQLQYAPDTVNYDSFYVVLNWFNNKILSFGWDKNNCLQWHIQQLEYNRYLAIRSV